MKTVEDNESTKGQMKTNKKPRPGKTPQQKQQEEEEEEEGNKDKILVTAMRTVD